MDPNASRVLCCTARFVTEEGVDVEHSQQELGGNLIALRTEEPTVCNNAFKSLKNQKVSYNQQFLIRRMKEKYLFHVLLILTSLSPSDQTVE